MMMNIRGLLYETHKIKSQMLDFPTSVPSALSERENGSCLKIPSCMLDSVHFEFVCKPHLYGKERNRKKKKKKRRRRRRRRRRRKSKQLLVTLRKSVTG
jgi:hypothetical protein